MLQDHILVTADSMPRIAGVVINIFWLVFAGAALVRIVVALVRRRPGDIRRGVVQPMLNASAVQSQVLGWEPYRPQAVQEVAVEQEAAPRDIPAAPEAPGGSPEPPDSPEPTDSPSNPLDPRSL